MSDSVKVVARFRPINKREREEQEATGIGGKQVVFFLDQHNLKVDNSARGGFLNFTFDGVFPMDTQQGPMYDISASGMVKDLFNGYNGTYFAYGQTGAGKSFTMFGADIENEELRGIIPRASFDIFDIINENTDDVEYTIRCSFLEIYNEQINDLLDASNTNLKVHESAAKGIHVSGLSEEPVSSVENIMELLRIGENSRSVSFTEMNAVSSRSHSLFQIFLQQRDMEKGTTISGKLNLVDLAGSEKVGKTQASGQTLREAQNINGSLSALGKVINALVEARDHIPYRDSKLTRILQDALGGNSKTTLMIACSPHEFNIEETISTLRFGKRAKSIKLKAKANKVLSPGEMQAMIDKLKKDLATVKAENKVLREAVTWYKENAAGLECPVDIDGGNKPSDEQLAQLDAEMEDALQNNRKKEANANAAADLEDEINRLKNNEKANIQQIEDLSAELSKLKESLKKLDGLDADKVQKMKDDNRSLKSELSSTQGELQTMQVELENAQSTIKHLEASGATPSSPVRGGGSSVDMNTIQHVLAAGGGNEALENMLKASEIKLHKLETEHKETLDKAERLTAENKDLKDYIDNVEGSLDTLVAGIDTENLDENAMTNISVKQLRALGSKIKLLQSKLNSAEREKNTISSQLEEAQDAKKVLDEKIIALKESAPTGGSGGSFLQQMQLEEYTNLKSENQSLELQVERLERKVKHAEVKLNDELERKTNKDDELFRIEDELDQAQRKQRSLQYEVDDLTYRLEQSDKELARLKKSTARKVKKGPKFVQPVAKGDDFRDVLKNILSRRKKREESQNQQQNQ
ncbi:hypothetical protein PCE1_002036 [Barthelona sp. PCE]